MLSFGFFHPFAGAPLNVAFRAVHSGMSMQQAAEEVFIEPLIALPRALPEECVFLFLRKLQRDHLPEGVDLHELRAMAAGLLVYGWEAAMASEGGKPDGTLDRVSVSAFPDLRSYVSLLAAAEPNDSLSFDLRRGGKILSRLFLEGQHAWLCQQSLTVAPMDRMERALELAAVA